MALEHNLVDYKVCAIDGTWSGLKFVVRGANTDEKKRPAAKKKTKRK